MVRALLDTSKGRARERERRLACADHAFHGDVAQAPRAGTGSGTQQPGQAAVRPRTETPGAATRGNPGPENFPRIDRSEQRDRDLKARQIVERELSSEQRLLEDARRQLAALGATATDKSDPRAREWQAAVSRHERNIAEIQRQLAVMK
jgi:hypothetical protein